MSQIKSLFVAYWPIIVPTALVLSLVLSPSARRVAKVMLRGLSRPLLLLAVIALVYDGTRSISTGNGSLIVTSVGEHWTAFAPTSLQNFQTTVRRRVHPALWDDGMARLLRVPSWLMFGAIGVGLAWAGRRRDEVRVFAN